MENTMRFEKVSFAGRMKSMLKVDFRRMLRSKLFYILIACALVIPILMTVMMTMMDGQESVNQQTGEITIMEGPENVWQNIGTLPGEPLGGDEIFMMCNVNMAFMGVCVFVCLFISDDFRSGYAKNLFTVRAKKGDYVISKMLAGFVCGALMLIAYFIGAGFCLFVEFFCQQQQQVDILSRKCAELLHQPVDPGRRLRAGIKKFIRLDVEIFADIKEPCHGGQRPLVFYFVDVAFALPQRKTHISCRYAFFLSELS